MAYSVQASTTTTTTTTTTTVAQIPCCLCGTLILPNEANQCGTCLAQEIDLKQKLQQGPGGADYCTIYQCRQCRRYQQTEKLYQEYHWESAELLSLCLKRIPALASSAQPRLQLVDAGWIWTEPHSMRMRLHLTVRLVVHNVTVQQRVMVELHVQFKQCPDCNRQVTNRTWHALVQLRQKRTDDSAPKKGLAALEQALSKNKEIRKHVLRIDTERNGGFDFYFLELTHAQQFTSHLQRIAPVAMRVVKHTKKLVSTDVKNNTANMKHTLTCELVPLCRDDLVLIDKSTKGQKLAGRLVLVTKVSSVIHLVDASPKRNALSDSQMEVSPEPYYRHEKSFTLIQASHRMVRFVVLDVELLCHDNDDQFYRGPQSGIEKYALADVQVVRESDFGIKEPISCVTHLGHLIRPGDTVLGYDLVLRTNLADDWEVRDRLQHSYELPDVVLVKKVNEGDANDDEAAQPEDGTKKMSKKKQRRQKRQEGKKRRELEESAVRMGFFSDDQDDENLDADLASAAEQDLAVESRF